MRQRINRPFSFRTALTFRPEQTPQQRAYQVTERREADARKRMQCDVLEFWRECRKARCRRTRGCEGDMHACFTRRWWALPEENRVLVRSLLTAARDGHRGEALTRETQAQFVEHFRRIAHAEAAFTSHATPL